VIPTIDLAADSPERQAALIKHALSSVGFFAVQGAGPASEDIATVFRDVSGTWSLYPSLITLLSSHFSHLHSLIFLLPSPDSSSASSTGDHASR
jgi:hypothetical protein